MQKFTDTHDNRLNLIAAQLANWASYEASKEIALLRSKFGSDIQQEELYSQDFGAKLIEALNMAMNFQKMYQRFITRIAGPEGKKGTAWITAAQYLHSQLADAIYLEAKNSLKNLENVTKLSMEQIGSEIFSKENLDKALETAIFKTLKESGDWKAGDENKGYKDFLQAIENQGADSKNQFIASFRKLFQLDELRQQLIEDMNDQDLAFLQNSRKKTAKQTVIAKKIRDDGYTRGEIGEIMAQKVAEIMAGAVGGKVEKTGNFGGKSDITMTFGFDDSSVMDVIKKGYNDRGKRVEAYKTLNERLRKLGEGSFIVYTNVKDYSLFSGFEGFSTGEALNLQSLEGVISNTPSGSQELISYIMSTMEGAMYADQKGVIEEELAQKMAFLLFDDVTTIGVPSASSDHAIHLMMLDGVYIPLSYLFFLLSNSISQVDQEIKSTPKEVIDVEINAGSIAFPTGKPSNSYKWGKMLWLEQKQIAYEQIKIKAKFLANFRDVIGKLMGK